MTDIGKGVHRALIAKLYDHNFTIAVEQDQYDDYIECNTIDEAIQEVEAYDGGGDFLVMYDNEKCGFVVLAIGYGNNPDEYVADWQWNKDILESEMFNLIASRVVMPENFQWF